MNSGPVKNNSPESRRKNVDEISLAPYHISGGPRTKYMTIEEESSCSSCWTLISMINHKSTIPEKCIHYRGRILFRKKVILKSHDIYRRTFDHIFEIVIIVLFQINVQIVQLVKCFVQTVSRKTPMAVMFAAVLMNLNVSIILNFKFK